MSSRGASSSMVSACGDRQTGQKAQAYGHVMCQGVYGPGPALRNNDKHELQSPQTCEHMAKVLKSSLRDFGF